MTMRNGLRFWRSLRRELVLAFVLSLSTYLMIRLWLQTIPEKFRGGAILGDVVAAISLSIMAAFIFYLVNVHLKDFRARLRINAYIGPLIKRIMLDGLGYVHSLEKGRVLAVGERSSYTVPVIKRLLKVYSSPGVVGYITVLANYAKRMESIRSTINEVLVYNTFLDTKLIEQLNRIKGCYLFGRLSGHDGEEELSSLAEPIYELMLHLKDLHSYTNRHIPGYHEEPVHPDFAMYELYLKHRGELRKRRREARQ